MIAKLTFFAIRQKAEFDSCARQNTEWPTAILQRYFSKIDYCSGTMLQKSAMRDRL